MRDEFTESTISKIARRVGYLCSNPQCRRPTIGPKPSGDGWINIGVAAHITAAAPGGPRFDASLTDAERRHPSNGILLCSDHAALVDRDPQHYTVERLRKWKQTAEERALAAIATRAADAGEPVRLAVELDEADRALIRGLGLLAADDIDTVTVQMRAAARADIEAFKGVPSWPTHSVPLNLRTRDSSGEHALTVVGLANAIEIADELTLVAGPGTGKTTTLTHLADAMLARDSTVPVFVPLAEWSTRGDSILGSLPRRRGFQAFREQHFMLLAAHARIALLLDGWNELDATSRRRVAYELDALRRDYPMLAVAVSTRRQAVDVPVAGPTIEIDALSMDQQLEIARTLRGADGGALLEHAWRTPGVRELISVPLYLTALIAATPSGAMPGTKEEVLRLFVEEHERGPGKVEALQAAALGFHRDMLAGLAVAATTAANTAIEITRARTVVNEVSSQLAATGQISVRPQPSAVLDALVNHHTLIRLGADGVSFQHQQFQEWHASFEVENLMLSAARGGAAATAKCDDVLNMPAWEEPVLFACERSSRSGSPGIEAVAVAVRRALAIDPMLAAEMIYRASDAVWDRVRDQVLAFAQRWHTPGQVDRAVRFMITTGRPEFASSIWPLIANSDSQIYLSALRAARRFRIAVLGPAPETRLATIPDEIRAHVVAEIAGESGMDGIQLATAIAKNDPSAQVQFAVIEALQFRRADRSVADVLSVAPPEVWSKLAEKGYAEEVADPDSAARLRSEREAYVRSEGRPLHKIGLLLDTREESPTVARQIADLIESEQFPPRDDHAAWRVGKAFERYPTEVTSALIKRLEAGRELPFRSEELLNNCPAIDDGPLVAMVLNCTTENRAAEAAARVIGPKTVALLIDKFIELDDKLRAAGAPAPEQQRNDYDRTMGRLQRSPVTSFLQAILSRGDTADPALITHLADLVGRHGGSDAAGPLRADAELLDSLARIVAQWIDALLRSATATRHQFAEVVRVVERMARPEFVDGLRRLLTEDLARRARAREDFFAAPMGRAIPPDVSHSYTLQYRQAFIAIGDDRVTRLMKQYLPDLAFGIDAAMALRAIWNKQHGTPEERRLFVTWPDFSEVRSRRARRRDNGPGQATPYAESIFSAVRHLIRDDGSEADKQHALALATIALGMPYGDQSTTIESLLALGRPMLEKRNLLAALIVAGETISADRVIAGLSELIVEESRTKPWLLGDQSHEVERWLQLLPFSDRPEALMDALALVDAKFLEPWRIEGLLKALGAAPSTQSDYLLGTLAERDPRLYEKWEWRDAIVRRDTPASNVMVLSLLCDGRFIPRGGDSWSLSRELAGKMHRQSEFRRAVLQRYQQLQPGLAKSLLGAAIAESPDDEALGVLIDSYAAEGHGFDGLLQRAIMEVALGKRTLPQWRGAFEHYSVDVSPLRKRLFGMLTGDGPPATLAEACLTAIDELRDEHGRVDTEPRHPDIASGRPWPRAAELLAG